MSATPADRATAPRVVVVGAGAAGLAASAEAALHGARVLLLEKGARPGIKILISGGGHCNVTTSLGVREALPHFGKRGARFLRNAVRETPPSVIRSWLHERGVPTFEAEFEKVWPVSRKASDVVRALVARCEEAGVEMRFGCAVDAIAPREGGWRVSMRSEDGAAEGLDADRLVLATGGLSYPKTGTTGDGYAWLRGLGLPIVEPRPALAPLRATASWVRELAGLTLEGVEVQLRDAQSGRIEWRRPRPVLFTHKGVSGPGPMDASGRIEREPGRYAFCVDLLPSLGAGELRERLFEGKAGLERKLARDLGLPKRLASSIVERVAEPERPASEQSKRARRALLAELRGLAIPVEGSLGFAHAEVTCGGLDLGCVDPKTMELASHPSLFVTGELLDVDGPIGGFSFLIAFSTGALAGRSAARRATRASAARG